jgi:hypothetical protein
MHVLIAQTVPQASTHRSRYPTSISTCTFVQSPSLVRHCPFWKILKKIHVSSGLATWFATRFQSRNYIRSHLNMRPRMIIGLVPSIIKKDCGIAILVQCQSLVIYETVDRAILQTHFPIINGHCGSCQISNKQYCEASPPTLTAWKNDLRSSGHVKTLA